MAAPPAPSFSPPLKPTPALLQTLAALLLPPLLHPPPSPLISTPNPSLFFHQNPPEDLAATPLLRRRRGTADVPRSCAVPSSTSTTDGSVPGASGTTGPSSSSSTPAGPPTRIPGDSVFPGMNHSSDDLTVSSSTVPPSPPARLRPVSAATSTLLRFRTPLPRSSTNPWLWPPSFTSEHGNGCGNTSRTRTALEHAQRRPSEVAAGEFAPPRTLSSAVLKFSFSSGQSLRLWHVKKSPMRFLTPSAT